MSLSPRLLLGLVAGAVALAIVAVGLALGDALADRALPRVPPASHPAVSSTRTVTIVINKGENARSIGEKLQSAGVIRSATWFRLLAQAEGIENDLAAGTYTFAIDSDIQQVLDRIKVGLLQPQVLVTIPEGLRMEQIAQLLQDKGVVNADALLQLMRNDPATNDPLLASRPDVSLEGYLFPDTYYFPLKASPEEVIGRMLADLDKRIDPDLQQAIKAEGLTIHEAITLASIVEREAQVPSERPIIASVFLNRLKQGMPLGADPTVQYALATNPENVQKYGWWKQNLTVDDLKIASPYNTYVNAGLPPGPICNPGRDSIAAVAHPAQTDYLYFVAKNDGSGTHAFATTLAQQEANIQKYQH